MNIFNGVPWYGFTVYLDIDGLCCFKIHYPTIHDPTMQDPCMIYVFLCNVIRMIGGYNLHLIEKLKHFIGQFKSGLIPLSRSKN